MLSHLGFQAPVGLARLNQTTIVNTTHGPGPTVYSVQHMGQVPLFGTSPLTYVVAR
jgi:hypothetical protein